MSFSPKMTSSEIAKIRLAIAIRSTIHISKKVLFYVCKTMKNGALWVAYKIDGVKCSTFVSRSKFEGFVKDAANSPEAKRTYEDYLLELVSQHSNVTVKTFGKIISLVRLIPNRIKDIKMDYDFIYDETDGMLKLYVDASLYPTNSPLSMKYGKEFPTLKQLISHVSGK